MPGQVLDIALEGLPAAFRVPQLLAVLFREPAPYRLAGSIAPREVEELAYLGEGEAVIFELLNPPEVDRVALVVLAMGAALAPGRLEETELFVVADRPASHAEEGGKLADAVGSSLVLDLHIPNRTFHVKSAKR